MQNLVISRSRKNLFIIEKMQFLLIRQRDLRMPFQKVIERSRPGLLSAGHDEIESFHRSSVQSKHRINRALAVERCLRDKFPVTIHRKSRSQRVMLQALGFGSEILLIAEFTLILIVLLLLSLMAIPGRVRTRKR